LVLQPRLYDIATANELLRGGFRESPFDALCADIRRLLQAIAKQNPKRLETFDVCPFAAHAFTDYMRWQSSKKDSLCMQRRLEVQMGKLASLKAHIFFQEQEDMSDAIEKDI
jgi:hypothetical protein